MLTSKRWSGYLPVVAICLILASCTISITPGSGTTSQCQGNCAVGSENISAQSLDQNRELGIIVSDANVLSRLQTTFQKDWAISQSV